MPIKIVMSTAMEGVISAFELSLLTATNELQNVKRAISNQDLAAVVRACARAFKTADMPGKLRRAAELKSAEASNKFRKEGNEHYQKRAFRQAIVCYNKALANAPNNSLQLALAYSNISAVMFTIEAYKACQMNIKAALQLDCPEYLIVKLKRRMVETDKFIIEYILREIIIAEEDILKYAEFEVERNAVIPCVSTDVCVEGNKVVAAKEIKSGTMVAMERAYVSNQDQAARYTSCYYCHRMCFFFIPCEGCTKALFCGKECKEKCLKDYHRVECHIVGYLYIDHMDINQELNKLAVKAAIQMSLKLGWEELRVASLEMGKKRLEKSSVAEAFDSNNPTSLLCYDDEVAVKTDVLINKSLFCAAVLHLTSRVPNYWPEGKKEKAKAVDTLSRIILHLNTTFSRKIPITSSAIDTEMKDSVKCIRSAQRNVGWFSFTSKLAHSCEPNLLVLGFNDHVALIALQRIKKGDQLTISFIDHFYDLSLVPSPKDTRIRQQIILTDIQYKCECRVCLLEWESTSHVQGTLTNRQKVAYNQYKSAMKHSDFKRRMKAICVALDGLTGCINTTQHHNVYKDLTFTLNICQCLKYSNKIYGRAPIQN